MTHSKTPFESDNEMVHMKNIVKTKQQVSITFRSSLSNELKSLIIEMLNYRPEARPDMNAIFEHPWMKLWEQAHQIQYSAVRHKMKEMDIQV